MADLAILFLIVILAIGITVAGVTVLEMRHRADHWRLDEVPVADVIEIRAVRGEQGCVLGSVRVKDPAFSYKIEELRAECLERVVAMNSGSLYKP